jgi:hypothetical protein
MFILLNLSLWNHYLFSFLILGYSVQDLLFALSVIDNYIQNINKVQSSCHIMSSRRKAREHHMKEALKDMIPPQDPLSTLIKGERDVEDLMENAIKKVKEKK